MIKKLKKIYFIEQFNPRLLGVFVNPFYFSRKALYKYISEFAKKLNGKVLDIGCGSKPYEELCNATEYVGIEIKDEGNRNHAFADVLYDGNILPFKDKDFDGLLSSQVFEHVFNPKQFLKEANRVTKLGGMFLITVPFIWDEHEQPYDFARYTSFGMKHILNENGFEIVEYKKSCNGIELIFQLINAYTYKVIFRGNKYINLLLTLFFIAPINLLGLIFSKILPKNNDLYLDSIILAKKIKDIN
ncbi:class I SAM-dependent methyltransferase [Francisella hispaniensis]|uniref:Conserved domain protein n=1 Tax=Francisella hispaniensis TaxID=622488 RepID=F4BGJ2_9GAMM|nr:class I SAM-dependent methyltransferase [Francisella hispaniensis]AEE26586.1 Conserved domain protein [Francisella hispaniensis]